MPNRILREGIVDSDAVGAVSIGAECLFLRLVVLADDFGRFDGRVTVVCRRAFVNRRSVDEHMTGEWLTELHEAGLIALYDVGGKPFMEILNFRQRTRANGSKYPARGVPAHTNQQDSGMNDGHSAVSGLADDRPPRTYSYSKSYSGVTPLPPCQGAMGADVAPGAGGGVPVEPAGQPAEPVGDAGAGVGAAGDAVDGAADARKARAPAIGIKAWLQGCAERGEKPVPEGSAPLRYAEQAGLPPDVVALHWREFKARHAESGKRYRDWPAALLNSLRGNWYGLWLLGADGVCTLSTKGRQAQRVAEVAAGGGAD